MRRTNHPLSLILLLSIFFQCAAVHSQVAVTPEMMRAYQNLTPEQRAQALRMLEGGGGDMDAGIEETYGEEDPMALNAPGLDLDTIAKLALDNRVPEGDKEPRIEGGDTLIVEAVIKADADVRDTNQVTADINRARLLGSRVYPLDKRGILDLPGIASIPIAGLTADEVAIRLASEPLLSALDFTVTILPLAPRGTAALEPFGYTLFGGMRETRADGARLRRSTFDASTPSSLPVPDDYVIGPGDSVRVQLYGNENDSVTLTVQRDGMIGFPRLGPRAVAGLTFRELNDEIGRWVDKELIGTKVAVSMGRLRSIQIFVVGEVKTPGGYTVSGLARMTHALFKAGGITRIGSLRQVQLRRSGELIGILDLYSLLLQGDTRQDLQLRANDVLFVPPAKTMVGIDGEVRRPAIYELCDERTVGELIDLAGGLLPTADATTVSLKRVSSRGSRSIETLDVERETDSAMVLQSGDLVSVLSVLEEVDDAVELTGHTTRPGYYEWSPGMRLTDLIASERMLKRKADLGYVLIRREEGADRQATVLSADLGAALADPAAGHNVPLHIRDRIIVFELGVVRAAAIAEILEEFRAQATLAHPFRMVGISGEVRSPGKYPLEDGMRISDLLRAGGGLRSSAFSRGAELTRYIVDTSDERETRLIPVDLKAVLAGDAEADMELKPYDYLSIKEIPAWEKQNEIELLGEVRFPGVYPVRRGETLRSVLERAGGLTDHAFPAGSVFTRLTLREREADQLKVLERRLEADLAGLGLRAAADPSGNAQQAMSVGQSLLDQLRNTEPVGRLVIHLDKLMATDMPNYDVVLRDGDKLYIPQKSQEIMVLGEVQYATSHLFASELGRDGYIDLSGGLTSNADRNRIYVVRANGAVQAARSSRWFRGGTGRMYPGDTIVVPMDTDRVPSVVQWASITQILYNLAISVAAVNSF